MEKYYTADAIIIKGISYGEGHRIFTFYGKEEGKFSAVARGVKKPKSKLNGHLQLGNRCDLQLIHGKSLDTVSQAVAKETYPHLRESASLYFYASYFLELLNDFVAERVVDPALFQLLDTVLKGLAEKEPAKLTRFFELKLLALSGYQPDFHRCAVCGEEIKAGFLNPRFHGIICEKCGNGYEITPKTLFALNYLADTETRLVRRLKTDDATDQLMGKVTKMLIEHSLEKKVKSLAILNRDQL
ncbi:MAG TPA: DNA repair protein RecO [Clostridiales bacterium]|nr:DNA repair protein RecO [Clostridiales bacterium]